MKTLNLSALALIALTTGASAQQWIQSVDRFAHLEDIAVRPTGDFVVAGYDLAVNARLEHYDSQGNALGAIVLNSPVTGGIFVEDTTARPDGTVLLAGVLESHPGSAPSTSMPACRFGR